jgi:hypothetical protein
MSEFRLFADAGFDVALCSGPSDGEECPLVEGGDCRLVDDADLVLMGPGMAGHRAEVAAAILHHREDLPVVVQVPRSDVNQCPPGCVANPYPSSVDGQVRALWRVLDGRPSADRPASPPAPPDTPYPSTAESSTMARLIDLLGW